MTKYTITTPDGTTLGAWEGVSANHALRNAVMFSGFDDAVLDSLPAEVGPDTAIPDGWVVVADKARFRVFHPQGADLGIYWADSAEGAIEACVRDAGYDSVEDMERRLGQACELEAVEA